MRLTPPSHQRQSVSRPYSRSPGGLLVPLHATLAGRVRWQVLDERGVPEIPRTPSGTPVGPTEGVEQPNLITDLGMDRMAVLDAFGVLPGSTATWRRRMAVGTGSTAPDVSDTTLDNEVQRDASAGTFNNGSTSYELDATANVWTATSVVRRVVTMTADRNLTEFGFAQNTTADIIIRELLRDGGGTPITVSLLTGKTLLVTHTLIVELPAPVAGLSASINIEEYDAGNNLTATIPVDVTHGGHTSTLADQTGIPLVWDAWVPHKQGLDGVRAVTNDGVTYARDSALETGADLDPQTSTNTAPQGTYSTPSYANGSFQRIKRWELSAGQLNRAWHGYALTGGSSSVSTRRSGWLVVFDGSTSYTKVNTDTLRVGFVSTWARA